MIQSIKFYFELKSLHFLDFVDPAPFCMRLENVEMIP
jgi:hypothetical protein